MKSDIYAQTFFDKLFFGKLDITFYRDDYRLRSEPLKASSTQIDFDIESKSLILISMLILER